VPADTTTADGPVPRAVTADLDELLDAIGEANAADVLRAVIDAAKGGDVRAAEVVLPPPPPEREAADALYAELRTLGLDVLYDDRDSGPGEKFADAELLGCPLRLTIGRRTAAAGEIECQLRRGRDARTVPLEGTAQAVVDLWSTLP
jgi:hypothetical protein